MSQIFIKDNDIIIGSFDPTLVQSIVVNQSMNTKLDRHVKITFMNGETSFTISSETVNNMFKDFEEYINKLNKLNQHQLGS